MADLKTNLAALELRILASSDKIPGWVDPHERRALEEFGTVDRDARQRAKEMNWMELYGAGQINLARIAGHYPLKGSVA